MLQTVEVEIDVDGSVSWLEPLHLSKRSRGYVTILPEPASLDKPKGNVADMLALLQSPAFANRKSYSAEEIEAQIQEARDAWE